MGRRRHKQKKYELYKTAGRLEKNKARKAEKEKKRQERFKGRKDKLNKE